MPHGGGEGSHGGMDNIMGVNGPLARSGRDLALYCSVMLQDEPWLLEHDNLELPWNLQPLNLPKRFCFAFLKDDGVVRPHPPILEALERTRKVCGDFPVDARGDLHISDVGARSGGSFNSRMGTVGSPIRMGSHRKS
jgi:hypothetical protein